MVYAVKCPSEESLSDSLAGKIDVVEFKINKPLVLSWSSEPQDVFCAKIIFFRKTSRRNGEGRIAMYFFEGVIDNGPRHRFLFQGLCNAATGYGPIQIAKLRDISAKPVPKKKRHSLILVKR